MRDGSNRFEVHVGDKFSEVDRVHAVCAVLQLLFQRRLLICLSSLISLYVPCCCCCCCCLKTKGKERKIEAVVAVILDAVDRG